MSITIYSKGEQAVGQFNNGEILENKPVGFPHEGGSLQPFSTLFYWAHAWTPGRDSLIGEHPHKGFEILSYVLKGSIKHYDNKNDEWQPLQAGDLQIVRAGSGITHAENVNEKSSFFQIWFDPNLNESLSKPASYDILKSDDFPVEEKTGITRKILKGVGSPLSMQTPIIGMFDISFVSGEMILPIPGKCIRSVYVIDGKFSVNEKMVKNHDFILLKNESNFSINAKDAGRCFILDLPAHPGYTTYSQQNRL